MSQNKAGIKIIQTEEKLTIRCGETFSEKASSVKEIIQSLESQRIKKVSLLLSTKTKNFQSTYFRIRRKIIEEGLTNAQLFLTNHSGASFKQKKDTDMLCIQTNDYSLFANIQMGRVSVQTTSSGKIFADNEIAKEVAFIIKAERPSNVNIVFTRGKNERQEAYVKRIKNLIHYFTTQAIELPFITNLNFSVGTKDKLTCVSSYTRQDTSLALVCIEQKEIPVKHSKHRKRLSDVYTREFSKAIV